MKRDVLDALTEQTGEAVKALPEMVLRGDGEYLIDGDVVPKSVLLEQLHHARQLVKQSHDTLAAYPRVQRKAKETT